MIKEVNKPCADPVHKSVVRRKVAIKCLNIQMITSMLKL